MKVLVHFLCKILFNVPALICCWLYSGYCLQGCVVFVRVKSHTCSKGHMHGTAGGWLEESSLHMHVLRVQLSLNHRSPSSHSLLSLFSLYPCRPSVPTVFLSPLCPPFLLPFISPSSPVHSWPTVRVLSCFPAVSQSSPALSCASLAWT